MLHKRLGLLSFPNGKRAVPPTETQKTENGKKHTPAAAERRHNMEKAQTCSKLCATKMLRCCNAGMLGCSCKDSGSRRPRTSSLVSRPRVKGPRIRVGQELFERASFLEMTVAQKQIVVVNFRHRMGEFPGERGISVYLRCGEVSCCCFCTEVGFPSRARQPLGHRNLHQFQVKEDELQFQQEALVTTECFSASPGIVMACEWSINCANYHFKLQIIRHFLWSSLEKEVSLVF